MWGWWLLFLASFFFTIYLEFWLVNRLGYLTEKDKEKNKNKPDSLKTLIEDEGQEDIQEKDWIESEVEYTKAENKKRKAEDKKRKNDLEQTSFPLAIDYIDLQMGSFDTLGKFVLATILPGIFLGTIMGIYGVATIWINNELAWGYGSIGMGIFLVIVLTLLLYKDTTNIHTGIVDSKTAFKRKAYKDIQDLWETGQKNKTDEINYDRIKKITDFVQTIDAVSDWPFNPASLKKLAVTVLTAVVPLILSFFGLNITI